VDGVHPNGNLLAKRGNCFNKTIVENYNEIPCVSGKRTVQLSSIKLFHFNPTVQLADNLHRQIDKIILILQGIITN
jgi:hypothetical protein